MMRQEERPAKLVAGVAAMPFFSTSVPGQGEHEKCVTVVSELGVSAASARRFLIKHDWKLTEAEAAVQQHLDWLAGARAQIIRTPRLEELITSHRRFRTLRHGAEPVICVDFLWGRFLDGTTAEELCDAYTLFIEEVLHAADAERADQSAQLIVVCCGGPPPNAFLKLISDVFEKHFPERMRATHIYPCHWLVKLMVNGALQLIPRRTRARFSMLATEAELCAATGIPAAELPADLRGGVEKVKDQATKLGLGLGAQAENISVLQEASQSDG